MKRDIYCEQQLLFGLSMSGPTKWLKDGVIDDAAWADQAAVIAQKYRIPAGIVRQQAFNISPAAHDLLLDVAV